MACLGFVVLALVLAGCGGTHKPLSQQLEQRGNVLYLPDGSTVRLTVHSAAAVCPLVDEADGLVTLNPGDPSAVGWSVTVDGC